MKKRACGLVQPSDQEGKEFCHHCGCRFTSPGGLYYHNKVNVCGKYDEEESQRVLKLVREFRSSQASRQAPPQSASRPALPPPVSTPSRPLALPPGYGDGRGSTLPSAGSAYAHLAPEKRRELDAEMMKTEEYYGGLMREAMKMPEPEKSRQLASLKNRYNTKQSTTRKKYGIRLRERRSKAEIDAERVRLFGTLDGPSLSGANQGTGTPPYKKARVEEGPTNTAQPSNGQITPRKRVPVNEMGGLSGSQATAEMVDPTVSVNPVHPRQVQVSSSQVNSASAGTQDDPMAIDDESDSTDSDIPATMPAVSA